MLWWASERATFYGNFAVKKQSSYVWERAHLICILGCDVAFFPSFTSKPFFFVPLSFFLLFRFFLCARRDIYVFFSCVYCCCCSSRLKCVRNVYSLIETRWKKKLWKFSQHLFDDVWIVLPFRDVDFDNKTRLIVFWCDAIRLPFASPFSRIYTNLILWVGCSCVHSSLLLRKSVF